MKITVVPNKKQQNSSYNNIVRLEQFLGKYPRSVEKVLKQIIIICDKYYDAFPSQRKLAELAGIGMTAAKEAIAILREAGFIFTNYRHLETSQYRLSPILYDPAVRSFFKKLFLFIPLVLLLGGDISIGALRRPNKKSGDNYQDNQYSCNDIYIRKSSRFTDKNFLENNPIPNPFAYPALNSLVKKFKLSSKGRIWLSIFGFDTLDYIDKQMTHEFLHTKLSKRKIKNLFGYLFNSCKNRSISTNQSFDFGWAGQIENKLGISHMAPIIRISKQDYWVKVRENPYFKTSKFPGITIKTFGNPLAQTREHHEMYKQFKGLPPRPVETKAKVKLNFEQWIDQPGFKFIMSMPGGIDIARNMYKHYVGEAFDDSKFKQMNWNKD